MADETMRSCSRGDTQGLLRAIASISGPFI